jgi:hypothetical protein
VRVSSLSLSDIHDILSFIKVEVTLGRLENDLSFFFSASGKEVVEFGEIF